MKRRFTESAACLLRAHCPTCRDLEGGRTWRASLRNGFALPGDAVDFPCPHGGGWGKPLSRGLGDTIEKLITKLTFGRARTCGRCRKRRDRLNRRVPYGNGSE